jgi:hypothetical protein
MLGRGAAPQRSGKIRVFGLFSEMAWPQAFDRELLVWTPSLLTRIAVNFPFLESEART